jgi:hypothetical protein
MRSVSFVVELALAGELGADRERRAAVNDGSRRHQSALRPLSCRSLDYLS